MIIKVATMCVMLSAMAPVMGVMTCAMLASAAKSGGMASGIGGFFHGLIALSISCALGGVAAFAALAVFGEEGRSRWMSIALLVLNGLLTIPGVWVLARMDWE
jgi:hypothetical protein